MNKDTCPREKPRVLLTRPRAQAEATAARLRAEGWCDPVVAPVLVIDPVPWDRPETPPAAIVLTSANAAHALRTLPRTWPVYAVGTATAAAAHALGFDNVQDADGDVVALGALIRTHTPPGAGALLHLSGDTIAADPATALPAYRIIRRVVYRTTPATALPEGVAGVTAALLYSARSATLFATLFPHRNLTLACLSPAVAHAAGPGWRDIVTARNPNETDLLRTLEQRLQYP